MQIGDRVKFKGCVPRRLCFHCPGCMTPHDKDCYQGTVINIIAADYAHDHDHIVVRIDDRVYVPTIDISMIIRQDKKVERMCSV